MKNSIWTAIISSSVMIIAFLAKLICSAYGIVEINIMSYLFLIGFFVSAWVPTLINLIFKFEIRLSALIGYHVFLVLSITIGSLWGVYNVFAYYDAIIHFASGVLIALIAYSLFKSSKNSNVSLFWLFLIVFSVAMMGGAVWEIWEFSTDAILGANSQRALGLFGREALFDTMLDIICDFCGAILGSFIVILIERRKTRGSELKK